MSRSTKTERERERERGERELGKSWSNALSLDPFSFLPSSSNRAPVDRSVWSEADPRVSHRKHLPVHFPGLLIEIVDLQRSERVEKSYFFVCWHQNKVDKRKQASVRKQRTLQSSVQINERFHPAIEERKISL